MVWTHRVVIRKRIDPEIPSQITPDRVNVIRTILHVVAEPCPDLHSFAVGS